MSVEHDERHLGPVGHRRRARRRHPASGPSPSTGSSTTSTPAGGRAAPDRARPRRRPGRRRSRPSTRWSRYSSVEPCHSRAAFGSPIRVERPPASTTPAAVRTCEMIGHEPHYTAGWDVRAPSNDSHAGSGPSDAPVERPPAGDRAPRIGGSRKNGAHVRVEHHPHRLAGQRRRDVDRQPGEQRHGPLERQHAVTRARSHAGDPHGQTGVLGVHEAHATTEHRHGGRRPRGVPGAPARSVRRRSAPSRPVSTVASTRLS